jgi:hypothetical protein
MSFLKELKEITEVSKEEKRQGKKILMVLLPLILVIIAALVYFNVEWRSVDEAISKYDFAEARDIASDMACRDEGNSINGRLDCPRTLQMLKIIVSEANYMADNNEFTKALNVVEEINSLELYNKLYDAGQISMSQSDQKDELFLSLITKGLLAKSLDQDQINIYLTKVSSENKKEEIKNLIK